MLIKIENGINKVMDIIGAIAAALLLLLVLIIFYNVIGRYLFNASSIGLEELSWHFYAAIFLLGIPFALRTESHVRVDLLFENFSPKTQAIIDLVGACLFLIPFCLIVIWSGGLFTAEAWDLGSRPDALGGLIKQIVTSGVGESSQDPGGLLNRWIIKGVIPFSFCLLLLASFSFMLKRLRLLKSLKVEK